MCGIFLYYLHGQPLSNEIIAKVSECFRPVAASTYKMVMTQNNCLVGVFSLGPSDQSDFMVQPFALLPRRVTVLSNCKMWENFSRQYLEFEQGEKNMPVDCAVIHSNDVGIYATSGKNSPETLFYAVSENGNFAVASDEKCFVGLGFEKVQRLPPGDFFRYIFRFAHYSPPPKILV